VSLGEGTRIPLAISGGKSRQQFKIVSLLSCRGQHIRHGGIPRKQQNLTSRVALLDENSVSTPLMPGIATSLMISSG
jgi:hypothetical protein